MNRTFWFILTIFGISIIDIYNIDFLTTILNKIRSLNFYEWIGDIFGNNQLKNNVLNVPKRDQIKKDFSSIRKSEIISTEIEKRDERVNKIPRWSDRFNDKQIDLASEESNIR